VANENLRVAQAQQQAGTAQVDAAQAQVQNAELQLSYSTIVAPVSGRIAQRTVQTGNRVSVGQALMAVVEDNVWILANLKETQLERVRVGQPVDIKLMRSRITGSRDGLTVCSPEAARISPGFRPTMRLAIS